jgi:phosphatidylglycerol:prolipoprotein diacylglycerol transferase
MQPYLLFTWIHTYGLMLAIGFYAGWWLAAWRARAEGVDPDIIGNLVLICIIAGVGGARVLNFHFYRRPDEPFWHIIKVWEGGLTFYGGMVAAALAALGYMLWRRLPVWKLADILAPSVALGQAFGRLGCYLNGCCFGGLSSTCAWSVRFPGAGSFGRVAGSPAYAEHLERGWVIDPAGPSLLVHPTQLYAAAFLFAICALALAAIPLRRRYGEIFGLVCMLNAVSRYAVELVRRDTRPVFLGLRAGQVGAVIIGSIGLGIWLWARRSGTVVQTE